MMCVSGAGGMAEEDLSRGMLRRRLSLPALPSRSAACRRARIRARTWRSSALARGDKSSSSSSPGEGLLSSASLASPPLSSSSSSSSTGAAAPRRSPRARPTSLPLREASRVGVGTKLPDVRPRSVEEEVREDSLRSCGILRWTRARGGASCILASAIACSSVSTGIIASSAGSAAGPEGAARRARAELPPKRSPAAAADHPCC
mmetsp:Transcript_3944/g.12566  ORF Transcript_3944/g.12566 Transcript_3944/m.12566 type:complete len:204 (+) Transcript_3944:437-1048(+)